MSTKDYETESDPLTEKDGDYNPEPYAAVHIIHGALTHCSESEHP